MPIKVSFLIQQTTVPVDQAVASAHVAGWSEGAWRLDNAALTNRIDALANARAQILNSESAIIGYRVQNYTISGSKLVPGASSSVRRRYPGNSGAACDVPQMCFRTTLPTANGLNKATFNLRGIPDGNVTNGEANPTAQFRRDWLIWQALLQSDQWQMVGKALDAPTYQVIGIVAGVIQTGVAIVGVVANNTWVRLIRVRDAAGNDISGRYLVTQVDLNTNKYTLQGLQATGPANGLVRVDGIGVVAITDTRAMTVRAVVRKVGRPFEAYRGRGSRRTKAA